jgi:electron transfer flavoprotein beta subunit
MKILVAVKRVVDPYVKIRVNPDNTGVETKNIKMAMNPFDEIAVEEALRLREKNWAKEVVALTVGTDSSQETLRHALALGADRAILVRTQEFLESLNIAKVLKKIVDKEQPDLLLMGKQAIDDDNNQTPQMLAQLLGWGQATYASKIEPLEGYLEVTREIDSGLETLRVKLPAVVSTDLRLNDPRYANLPGIMKAKKKELDIIELATLGLSLKKHIEILKVTAPPVRSAGVRVNSVAELLDYLKNKAKVL